MATVCETRASLGKQMFENTALGDARLTARLVRSFDRMCLHLGGTLPQKFGSPADLQAFYRLCDREKGPGAVTSVTTCWRIRSSFSNTKHKVGGALWCGRTNSGRCLRGTSRPDRNTICASTRLRCPNGADLRWTCRRRKAVWRVNKQSSSCAVAACSCCRRQNHGDEPLALYVVLTTESGGSSKSSIKGKRPAAKSKTCNSPRPPVWNRRLH